ncbi:MAG: sigma-70 family RNA polymerase sigma factor [Verrucomicrobia bacterium]|nr:sigma-70 family RNA polymerase sigma factor [Verrucomicrobiota bacterium]
MNSTHIPCLYNEKSFLLKLAHNSAVDFIRKRNTMNNAYEHIFVEDFISADSTNYKDLYHDDLLLTLLNSLPTKQRYVILLKHWHGLTFHDISEYLNISVNTAASRYRYGINKLRRLFISKYRHSH